MELTKYLFPLRRWWWLLVAATLVAAISSFLVVLQQPPIYQSRTTLMIGRAMDDPNPSTNEFWLGQQLAKTYADIATREVVRSGTMAALGITWLPEYRARAVENSQLIEIVVLDTRPDRAQAVAAELANQLILQSPVSATDERGRREFVNQQLDTLQVQISQTQEEIATLQGELGNMVSARQITDTQNQIAALQGKLNTLQGNYASLLSNTQGGAVNTLNVIEPAGLPRSPTGPSKMISILVAAVIGFVLAASAAYLLEYLDNTLKTPEDVQRAIGKPVVAYIPETEDEMADEPLMSKHPRHPIAEAFRSLRTNLEFVSVERQLQTILITSSDTAEGKTSVATNLAIALAQLEKKVIIIDADMRRPSVHQLLGIPNDQGLSDVFRGQLQLTDAIRVSKNEKVAVIPAGSEPPNPGELLGSSKMDQILKGLEEICDVVVIDGPPFIVTDAAILSTKVDGVLVVVRPGFTHRDSAMAMMEQLKNVGARVVGTVLYRIPRKFADYYSGKIRLASYYTDDLYSSDDGKGESGGPKGRQPAKHRFMPSLPRQVKPSTPGTSGPAANISSVDLPKRGND